MKNIKYIIFLSALIIIFSCSTKRDIIYFQSQIDDSKFDISYVQYKVKVDDILKIEIKTNTPELNSNFQYSASSVLNNESVKLYSYQVNFDGYIYS